MNEELRKLLGINIAYGGDGDAAAADESESDTYAADALDAMADDDPSLAETDAIDALTAEQDAFNADANAAPFGGVIDAPTAGQSLAAQVGYDSLTDANFSNQTGFGTFSVAYAEGTYTMGPGDSATFTGEAYAYDAAFGVHADISGSPDAPTTISVGSNGEISVTVGHR